MKAISALGDQAIQDGFKRNYPDIQFLTNDLDDQEGGMDALSKLNPDALIFSMDIEGELDKHEFIKVLREINEAVKIVIIAREENKEYSNWLASKAVYHVFIDGKCTFSDIYGALMQEQKVIVKTQVRVEERIIEKPTVIYQDRVVNRVVPVSFNRLILAGYGNAEFHCELAFASSEAGYRTLLINLDLSAPMDVYISFDKNVGEESLPERGIEAMLEVLKKDNITGKDIEEASIRPKAANNLYVLSAWNLPEGIDSLIPLDVKKLLDCAYRSFDVVIALIGDSMFNPFNHHALEACHYVLAAIHADTDRVRQYELFAGFMKSKHNIQVEEKTRLVAWEYRDDISLPIDVMRNVLSPQNFMGCVSHSPKRDIYKNRKDGYTGFTYSINKDEYASILAKLGLGRKKDRKTLGKLLEKASTAFGKIKNLIPVKLS